MRYETVTVRHGEDCGPVDWEHPKAKDMPPIWREVEKRPEDFTLSDYQWSIVRVCMYDGWPYWKPMPAVQVIGPIGPEWKHFDSYGIDQHSVRLRKDATEYRGWSIHQGSWPEPAWMATGPNYDASYEGEEDGWVDNGEKADAPTREALIAEIDAWLEENQPLSHGDLEADAADFQATNRSTPK